MKSQLKYTFFIFSLLFIAGSCKKDILPTASQKGANTFGCKINGAVFIPHDVYTYPTDPGILATYNDSTKEFKISTDEPRNTNQNGLQRGVFLDVINPHIGINNFSGKNSGSLSINIYYQPAQYYQTNDTINGTMNITRFDVIAKIISGTFSFDAPAKFGSTGIAHITEGRFDVTYK